MTVQVIQVHTMLAQLDEHQTGIAEVPSLVLTTGNILLLISFCFHVVKSLILTLPILSSL